jgi:hypothetical protein
MGPPVCCLSVILSENRYRPRIKSGAGLFGITLYFAAKNRFSPGGEP